MFTIHVPDQILASSGLNEQEFLIELAACLYERKILSLGKAAAFAGIHRMQFQRELGKRKIPIHYTVQDLETDLANLKSLGI
ncbi:MAG: UPF0175 family protein [Bacteroidota bacterium]